MPLVVFVLGLLSQGNLLVSEVAQVAYSAFSFIGNSTATLINDAIYTDSIIYIISNTFIALTFISLIFSQFDSIS